MEGLGKELHVRREGEVRFDCWSMLTIAPCPPSETAPSIGCVVIASGNSNLESEDECHVTRIKYPHRIGIYGQSMDVEINPW